MAEQMESEVRTCEIRLRDNPRRLKETVRVGCGAGFGGDRPSAALKLLQRVDGLDYLVLECLAERTLADRFQAMAEGGVGYDPRMDPHGAQEEVLNIARQLGLDIVVSLAYEIIPTDSGVLHLTEEHDVIKGAVSTYVGAAPIVECLENYKPNVVITSRVADAALFLGPMLLDLSLPFAEVSYLGEISVAKADGSGGLLNYHTCAEQLLYEVGDPNMYITPDVIIDFHDVTFCSVSQDKVLCSGAKPSSVLIPDKLLQLVPKVSGWKGWGEISYGGYQCVKRAEAAKYVVTAWMEEAYPGTGECIASYIIGLDSLKMAHMESDSITCSENVMDVRLRMDGRFELKEHAVRFTNEFMALYTNGPASGGGISTGYKKEIILLKTLVGRETVFWKTEAKHANIRKHVDVLPTLKNELQPQTHNEKNNKPPHSPESSSLKNNKMLENVLGGKQQQGPAPSNKQIPLYEVAHSRSGDKGNDLNFSLIPYFSQDIYRLKEVITSEWVLHVMSVLLNTSTFPDHSAIQKRNSWIEENVTVEIYHVRGINSLNVVVRKRS